jgi:hypothetical protein
MEGGGPVNWGVSCLQSMNGLAERITAELWVLVGEPISDCWRAANMQVFEFGPAKKYRNRKGDEVEGSDLKLHVQCPWRMVDGSQILFARDDLLRAANQDIPIDEFDWDKDDSVLDIVQRQWFEDHRAAPLKVVHVAGDQYGGCQIRLEGGMLLELFPCDSDRGEYSEHWRLLDDRRDSYHFVVTGYGVEGSRESSDDS